MPVTRIVPNLVVSDVARANALYARLFSLEIAMVVIRSWTWRGRL